MLILDGTQLLESSMFNDKYSYQFLETYSNNYTGAAMTNIF